MSISVAAMDRARAFYERAFEARVAHASPGWTSLHVAGVRLGLALVPGHAGGKTGVHFAVADLAAGCAEVETAGGRVLAPRIEVSKTIVIAEVADPDGNELTLLQR